MKEKISVKLWEIQKIEGNFLIIMIRLGRKTNKFL